MSFRSALIVDSKLFQFLSVLLLLHSSFETFNLFSSASPFFYDPANYHEAARPPTPGLTSTAMTPSTSVTSNMSSQGPLSPAESFIDLPSYSKLPEPFQKQELNFLQPDYLTSSQNSVSNDSLNHLSREVPRLSRFPFRSNHNQVPRPS